MRWRPVVLSAAVSVGLAAGLGVAGAHSQADRNEMRQVFRQRVEEYAALHRHLEKLVPPEVVTSDLERLFAPRTGLAREMRFARANARQGDIFTPPVAVYFRVVIAETLWRHGITSMLAIIEEEEETVHAPPVVNADYPGLRSMPPIPPCLLAALPPLPPEVRYSFIGQDLILWDLHAGLIVDFVPRAVPVFTAPGAGATSK